MRSSLGNIVTVPRVAEGNTSIWACYTIRLPQGHRPRRLRRRAEGAGRADRDLLRQIDAHADRLCATIPVADGGLPVCEALSADVISLPVHAYLDEPTQDRVIEAVRGALAQARTPRPSFRGASRSGASPESRNLQQPPDSGFAPTARPGMTAGRQGSRRSLPGFAGLRHFL